MRRRIENIIDYHSDISDCDLVDWNQKCIKILQSPFDGNGHRFIDCVPYSGDLS